MSLSDPLGDLLTRIRNGQMAKLSKITSPASKLRASVLEVLRDEGYSRGYSTTEVRKGISQLEIELKYFDGEPVIREISRESTPGRRKYSGIKDLQRYRGGLGTYILSTPKGVMSDAQARQENVGGELLCRVF